MAGEEYLDRRTPQLDSQKPQVELETARISSPRTPLLVEDQSWTLKAATQRQLVTRKTRRFVLPPVPLAVFHLLLAAFQLQTDENYRIHWLNKGKMLSELPLRLLLKILQQMDSISFVRTFQTCKLIHEQINLSPTKFRKQTSGEVYVTGKRLAIVYRGTCFNMSNRLPLLNAYGLDLFNFRRVHITTDDFKYSEELIYLLKVLRAGRVECQEIQLSTPMRKEEILQFKPHSLEVDGSWEGFSGQYFRFFLTNVLGGVERLIIRSDLLAYHPTLVDFFKFVGVCHPKSTDKGVQNCRQNPNKKEIMVQMRDPKIDITKLLTKINATYYGSLTPGHLSLFLIPTDNNSFIVLTYDVEDVILMRITFCIVDSWQEFKQFYNRAYWFHKNIVNGPDLQLDASPRFNDVQKLFRDRI